MALLPTEREQLIAELARRKGMGATTKHTRLESDLDESFLRDLHPKQLQFVQSPSKRKVARTGRRGGKTHALIYMVMRAIRQYPGATIPYISLSRDQCRRMFWKPFEQLNSRYGLGLQFNRQRYIATAPNGAEVVMIGAQDAGDLDKVRGDKFPLALIDEAGSFGAHLEELVEDALDAALGDYDGTLVVTSSPPLVPAGFFYNIVTGGRPGWEQFHWTVRDNPHFPRWAGAADWREQAEKYLKSKADYFGPDSPKYRREYLGELAYDESALYFKFEAARNSYDVLPDEDWRYGIGVDFGYEDNTAFVVLATSPRTQRMFVVETFAKSKMLDEEIANRIRDLRVKYKPVKIIADFAQKQFVIGLNVKYQLGITAADKTERLGQIELLNSDFITGRVMISGTEKEFQHELSTVVWNATHDAPAATRHLGHHADRHDALRYIWRAMLPFRGRKEASEPAPRPDDIKSAVAQEALRVAKLERIARSGPNSLEAVYGSGDEHY